MSFGVSGLRVSKIVASKKTGASAKMAQKARIGVYDIKFVSIIMPSQKVCSGGHELKRRGCLFWR